MSSMNFENKEVIVFSKFEGMNTQLDRHDLPEDKAAWLENLQPIGSNNLTCVPAPATTPVYKFTGETIVEQYYFNYISQDYIINFMSDGSAWAVTNPGGTATKFANAGTFSTFPDCTQWGTQRILIADSIAGYCSWDTNVFVKYGGVSPNIAITAGGSGYTSPTVTITTSGSGTGATATVQQTAGIVTGITLTNAGSGYKAGDTVTFTIHDGGPGTGATATGHVWPNAQVNPTTLAVFSGRVWLGAGNVVSYTGTGTTFGGVGYDDFISGDASGSFTIQDADLLHKVEALRSLNNYLFIFGDGSVKQIGNISLNTAATATIFTIVTLSSDQGTIYKNTIISYNRLVLFTNNVGTFAVFGSSVEKISDEMDGVFRLVDFTQAPVAAVCDINNIHVYMLLVKYDDPIQGARALIMGFMNKKWFVMSQGNQLKYMISSIVNDVWQAYATSGNDITQILENASAAVNVVIKTSLTSHGQPFMGKRSGRYAVTQTVGAISTMNLLIESERSPNQSINYNISNVLNFVNNKVGALQFVNASGGNLNFIAGQAGFFYKHGNSGGVAGVYLGMTLSGPVQEFDLNSMMLEYGPGAPFGSEPVAWEQTL